MSSQRSVKRPITVAHIASGDLWAGAEVQLYNLAKELDKSEQVDLFVVLLNHGILEHRLMQKGVSVTVFDEARLNSFRIFLQIVVFLRRVKPDIVHTHRQKENILGSLAALFVRKTKSVRTVHGAQERRPRPWQLRQALAQVVDWICGNCFQQIIVAVSDDLAVYLERRFSKRNIRVIENGIDIGEIQKTSSLPVKLPSPGNNIRIAFIGRLVPVKRVDRYLRIAKQLTSTSNGVFSFYIFGDGELMGHVKNLIRELEIGDSVFIMGFQDNMPAYLAQMDLLFITSDYEGLPMNLLEALGLKVPIVSHAVGGIPKVLNYGECGTLVHTEQIAKYVEVGQQYVTNRQLLVRKAQNGYRRVKNRYSAKRNALSYVNIYEELQRPVK